MNRKLLISCLIIISCTENVLVNHYGASYWIGLLFSLPVIYGCVIWAREKNRNLFFGLIFGALAPIGLIGMGLLKDRSNVYEG